MYGDLLLHSETVVAVNKVHALCLLLQPFQLFALTQVENLPIIFHQREQTVELEEK